MKASKKYIVPFSGLKLGKHEFDYEIDKTFFDLYEYSLVKNGALKVVMNLEKQETMLILNFHIKGTVDLTCDRCLSEFPANMEVAEKQLVQFSDENESDADNEIIVLARNEFELDIAPLIYELINVNVPYYKVCNELSEQTCDENMLQYLQTEESATAPIEEEEKENTQGDPRWEALKKLKG